MKGFKKPKLTRFHALVALMFIIYAAILAKLVTLQIINHEDYSKRANSYATRTLATQAPRGRILDSTGVVLADNKISYTIEYLETKNSEDEIYSTLKELFSTMNKLSIAIDDNFALKIDASGNYYMDYGTTDESSIEALDLRFKKDRGLDYYLKKELDHFKALDEDKYTEEDYALLDQELLKVSPEELFYRLVKQYKLYNLLEPTEEEAAIYAKKDGEEITKLLTEKYTLQEIRNYLIVLDNIKMSSYTSYDSVTIASNISDEDANILMQLESVLPGINIKSEPVRYYPFSSLGSTVLGYMTSISSSNQQKYKDLGYDISSDKVGASGIESAFEKELVGTKSTSVISVDKYGNLKDELYSTDAVAGNDVQLTIDSSLQYTAERALQETLKTLQANRTTGSSITANATRGAVVVQQVNTGKVLAMASYPYYDPNDISADILSPDYEAFAKEYIKATGTSLKPEQLFSSDYTSDNYDIYPKALYNYATQGLVPTGSTFKFVTALAALEEGVVNPSEQILDRGIFNNYPEVSNYTGVCGVYETYGTTHGYENMTDGFRDSCNYYFYELAYRLYKKSGIDTLAKYAWKLGLGYDPNTASSSSTGIEIEERTSGQVYSSTAYTNLVSNMSRYTVVDMLEAGKYTIAPSLGKSHRPFNIGKNDEDEEALAEAKQAIKAFVAEKLAELWDVTNSSAFYDEVYNNAKDLLMKLTAEYPEQERAQYSTEDYENAALNIARYVVYDMSGDVVSVGNMLNSSIGLGMNNFTPLQLCSALCTVLNGGTRYESYLADKVIDSEGKVKEEYSPTVIENLNFKQSTVDAIKEGMAAVSASNSTLKSFPIATGAKTGTAIYSSNQKEIGRSSYSVFEVFAPYDNPEIAITVVLYDGGSGSNSAPVARAILETYFRDIISSQYPGYKSTSTGYSLNPNLNEAY